MPDSAPWDYIIVGSGAGGGPLAARLAQKKHRVLVLEAGGDACPPTAEIPAFHGAASEDPAISWEFFVKHYEDETLQKADTKYDNEKKGIFYPRAAGVGGCTIHNAMITIAGPTRGWDEIAEATGDSTWCGRFMRKYFQRLEHCDYIPEPAKGDDLARHGYKGWLHNSWLDLSLGKHDLELLKVLVSALKEAGLEGVEDAHQIAKDFIHGRALAHLDPNDALTQMQSPEGVRLVPMAIKGGERSGPRNFLKTTKEELTKKGDGDLLTIQTDTLVTKILWDTTGPQPRAVGVEVLRGARLYKAHPQPSTEPGKREEIRCNREVILCGGAFNTPQILMLSGVGSSENLARLGIERLDPKDEKITWSGVGENLQDRNEVTIVNEMKRDFALLANAAFGDPTVKDDPALDQWMANKTGLYATNGVVLCIQKRSRPDLPEPDLFIFGVPGEFRGYKRGYSKVFAQHKNRFTWAILKAYTSNRGTVTLKNSDPLEPPDVNFKYFGDGTERDNDDMAALVEGVRFVRRMNEKAAIVINQELWPGTGASDSQLPQFILQETWGHHACGTCKMGPADDPAAVVDSRFRVHGVKGLRVVDASIFPNIPGMFIVSHIYMISEKAADVIHEDANGGPDDPYFPRELHKKEADALVKRRELADIKGNKEDPVKDSLGLALSGGGIRSATFCLGIVQAMAKQKLLRAVDYLSTVSGGGYVGAFVGRFFTRFQPAVGNAPVHVEKQLSNPGSPEIEWLRNHANYIAPNGAGDSTLNLGIYLRSILTLHFVLGTLLFTFFGLANLIRFGLPLFESECMRPHGWAFLQSTDLPIGFMIREGLGAFWSPWFMVVEVFLLVLVLPLILGYWLASQDHSETYQTSVLIVTFLVASVLLLAGLTALGDVSLQPLFGVVSLLFAFVAVEYAWWVLAHRLRGSGSATERVKLTLPRAYMTSWLGTALFGTFVAFAFSFVDTIGHAWFVFSKSQHPAAGLAQLGAVLAGLMPLVQFGIKLLANGRKTADASTASLTAKLKSTFMPWVIALTTLLIWAILLSYVSHWAFDDGKQYGIGAGVTGLTLLISIALSWAIQFINWSSLQSVYAARLGRTYLGATNPARHNSDKGLDVTEDVPGDDLPILEYKPHASGGPVHIINMTVNQTTGRFRDTRYRSGEVVAVTAFGMTIGVNAHALWEGEGVLAPIPIPDGEPHPLGSSVMAGDDQKKTANSEMLTLRSWIAISGAAISAARGSATNIGAALLMGIANLRTGYWWRSGAYPPKEDPDETRISKWWRSVRRFFRFRKYASRERAVKVMMLLDLVPRFFLPQFLLIYELMAYFGGPWVPYWYLSDGGFFENLAVYELLRRRVRTIVCCDAGQDGQYIFEDLGTLIRRARLDFHAEIRFLSADEIRSDAAIPASLKKHLGSLTDLAPAKGEPFPKCHAALAYVYYKGSKTPGSLLLYVKLSMTGDESPDLMNYRAMHPSFPHDSTGDQFFDEPQWESYRALGEEIAVDLLNNHEGRFWMKEYPLESHTR